MAEDTGASDAAAGDDDADLDQHTIAFREGIPGFPDYQRFALIAEIEDAAFMMLQSLDDPDIALIVTVPWLFFPDYEPQLSPVEAQELDITDPEDAVVFCPVTLDPEDDLIYVNLLGPFVVNVKNREGRQLVLTDSDYPTRAAVDLSRY